MHPLAPEHEIWGLKVRVGLFARGYRLPYEIHDVLSKRHTSAFTDHRCPQRTPLTRRAAASIGATASAIALAPHCQPPSFFRMRLDVLLDTINPRERRQSAKTRIRVRHSNRSRRRKWIIVGSIFGLISNS